MDTTLCSKKCTLCKIETNLTILMMIFALYCPFLFVDSSQGLYRAVAASIDGSNYLVIDTTIYSTDLSCLFGIPQLQQENSSKLFFILFHNISGLQLKKSKYTACSDDNPLRQAGLVMRECNVRRSRARVYWPPTPRNK